MDEKPAEKRDTYNWLLKYVLCPILAGLAIGAIFYTFKELPKISSLQKQFVTYEEQTQEKLESQAEELKEIKNLIVELAEKTGNLDAVFVKELISQMKKEMPLWGGKPDVEIYAKSLDKTELAPKEETATESKEGIEGETVHEVLPNDNLYEIARKYYGDESKWINIYEANKDKIASANNLIVGLKLLIPDITSEEEMERIPYGVEAEE